MDENQNLLRILYESNMKMINMHFHYSRLLQFVGFIGIFSLLSMIAIFVIPHEVKIIEIVSGLFVLLLLVIFWLANWGTYNYQKVLKTLSGISK